MAWTKRLFDDPTDESLSEWIAIARLTLGDERCDVDLAEAWRMWRRSTSFVWQDGNRKCDVVFTDKRHTRRAAWKLQVFYDPADENEIVPLVVQTVRDFGEPVYVVRSDLPRDTLIGKVCAACPEIVQVGGDDG